MASIHTLIVSKGIEEARRLAVTKHDRRVVEVAYRILSEEEEGIGFTYSGFALTSLPHRECKEQVWRREGHNLTLLVESGRDRAGIHVGLPHGSYARFILLFLQSQAVKTGSREVELGRSMRDWMENNMGLGIGGKTYRLVSEQARRISLCRLTFYADRDDTEVVRNGGFVDGAISMSGIGEQPTLWQDRVLLNEEFYRALREHPVPVSEAGLRAIGPRSMAVDVYVWLAYRLHALRKDVTVSWAALYSQFGAGFSRLRDFRAQFLGSLEIAVAAYPDARISVEEKGVTLRPSRPAIAKAG